MSILKRNFQLIPLLLDSGYLPKKSILACRLLSKEIKATVDKELVGARKPAWLATAFTLETPAVIRKFMKKAERMGTLGGSLTPLFAELLHLTLGGNDIQTLQLLKKYGKLLLNFRLAFINSFPETTAISALGCIPNVSCLTLTLKQVAQDFLATSFRESSSSSRWMKTLLKMRMEMRIKMWMKKSYQTHFRILMKISG